MLKQIETNENSASELERDRALFKSIACADSGLQRAVGQLFDLYAHQFVAFLVNNGYDEPEDLVQQLFEKLLKNPRALRKVDYPKAYLWRMLRNAHVDVLRSRSRRPTSVSLENAREFRSEEPSAEYHCYLSCVDCAWDTFRKHNPEKAAPLEMVALGGLTGQELAEALGRSYGAAREFLSQCRKRFRAVVTELCGEESGVRARP